MVSLSARPKKEITHQLIKLRIHKLKPQIPVCLFLLSHSSILTQCD